MSLEDIRSRAFRPSYFRPSWQEADHTNLILHTSTDFADVVTIHTISIPKGVNALLVQALEQNIRYVLVGTPSQTSGFLLTAGNDPIAIPVVGGMTVQFIAETADARLEMQMGNL